MLIDTDPLVRARVNLTAILGALPRLAELSPEARAILHRLDGPVSLGFFAPGGLSMHLTFSPTGITVGRDAKALHATLLFRSPAHLTRVINGRAQPIPVGGPRALKFLATTFAPLSALLGSVLEPTPERLLDPAFAELNALLTLEVAAAAIAVVGNHDASGRYSSGQMPDGSIDLEIGDVLRYRLTVADHHLAIDPSHDGQPRAALRFADLDVAGGVLTGKYSAIACAADGRISMRGMIPLVDNVSRILTRASSYLGK
ncbi:MAG: hypothetical protein JWQ43_821 [Glaciihabitans sp.]|nr:hypothetical protein [Glaciihabitans sp.]